MAAGLSELAEALEEKERFREETAEACDELHWSVQAGREEALHGRSQDRK